MNFSLALPEITLFFGALIILMVDVFFGKKDREIFYFSHILAIGFCAISLFLVIQNFVINSTAFNQMFFSSSFTSLFKSIAILLLSIVILLSLSFIYSSQKISAEFLALLMIATVGGMFLISANDFLTFYLGIELQALPLYLLAAIKKDSAKSSEAGIKYFILGCLASGLLLFGISMVYGFSGTTNFGAILELYNGKTKLDIPAGVIFGLILVLTALFFKIAAAPFHMWSPDVYEGSPSIVTTFFATVAKFSIVIALIKFTAIVNFKMLGFDKIFILVAILSLAIGSFGAIFQTNFKRLLAYSSIGHIGFILIALSPSSGLGISAALLYITIYSLISLGSFGFLILIKSKDNKNYQLENDETNDKIFEISSLSGLSKTNPIMAFCLATLMFSSAGIPPLAGFFSKFYIIHSVFSAKMFVVSILAVLFSVISAFYYLRIVKIIYFDESKNIINLDDTISAKLVIFLCATINIILIFFLENIRDSINLVFN